MIETTVRISGMMCGMCEAHICDVIRARFAVRKVTASHSKGQAVILSESGLDEAALRQAIAETGYEVTAVSACPAEEKKGLFGVLRKGGRDKDIHRHLEVTTMNMTKWATFVGGVLFGTAGIKILSSKDAKKVYTHTTAAVLRAKDCVMATADTVRENAEDILADAKAINEKRTEEAAVIEDASEKAEQ